MLKNVPKRKTKCPHCQRVIYVRAKQGFFPRVTLTEEEARAVDWLKKLAGTPEEVDRERQQLADEFGRQPRPADVVWRMLHRRLSASSYAPQWYSSMALFRLEEGHEFFSLLQEASRAQLHHWIQTSRRLPVAECVKVEVITTGPASCGPCQRLSGTVFRLDEALAAMPIPVKDCSHEVHGARGWCRCVYGLVFDG